MAYLKATLGRLNKETRERIFDNSIQGQEMTELEELRRRFIRETWTAKVS